ncbi:DoxX family protein [Glaciimonas sp. CA11.2]|uniref:DoxX family protein n=1 Tax=unclassified Glaciimonas TaxID=2644401 RepID=UPI002AB3AC86|nr:MULTISPECIES: DoxX family protein [unclassified Glaciimonas]MDY7544852.1 DoxX family protein [Glaciimonas sp. CA11.2]MEB0014158.1 DoxX family protein [Glaciimonas sp. Cout2]MEB0083449.1 DoxX family protein [Glaciimonas sp. Gout2]MEB0164679.1 DoxX family protein [Glaciimonas sp. CA11.2]
MQNSDDIGKLILRATLAILILFHGISKIFNGPGFVVGLVSNAGLPPAVAYLVYVGEVLAPIMILLGIWTRVGALIIVINMLFAFSLVHSKQLMTLSSTGGWGLELQGFYLFIALAILLLGAGRMSIGGRAGRWN